MTPAYRVLCGDAAQTLKTLAAKSVDVCITSPPYWGLRNYGPDAQLGQEASPEQYVSSLATVFAEVRRVLRSTGSLWLVLGDNYYGGPPERQPKDAKSVRRKLRTEKACERCGKSFEGSPTRRFCTSKCASHSSGQKRTGFERPKCLLGLPWRVATALVHDGWVLRNDIIWKKPNRMPSVATDRLPCSYEHVFHFVLPGRWVGKRYDAAYYYERQHLPPDDVWTVPTVPGHKGHPAPFPPNLIRPLVQATCPPGGLVLDPFSGSGTTGHVANQEGRSYLGIELNPEYLAAPP